MAQTSPGSVADMLWAAAVLDSNAPAALSKLRELAATVDASQLNAETLQQIFQAHMALDRSVAGSVVQGAPLLPSQMLEQAKAAWQDRPASSAAPKVHVCTSACLKVSLNDLTWKNALHKPFIPNMLQLQCSSGVVCRILHYSYWVCVQILEDVGAALRNLGISYSDTTPSEGGLFKPDLALTSLPGKVALSVDGASSFSINPPHQPLGHAILGWRLLMLHGWKVRTHHPRMSQVSEALPAL